MQVHFFLTYVCGHVFVATLSEALLHIYIGAETTISRLSLKGGR